MNVFARVKLLASGVAIAVAVLGLSPAGASSANISHSFNASGTIPDGSIVSVDKTRSDYVQLANSDNGRQLLGVALPSSDSLLAVDARSGSVQVATSGTVSTLVSTLNGDIKVGDQVSVSPFNGIGSKVTPGSFVIGLAQTEFNADSEGAKTQEVTDSSGKSKQIAVGYIRLNIGIGTSSSASGGEDLNSLQRLAKSLTGHTVPTARIIIALVIAIVTFLALITLIYASIYGGIISIGRNPLAKYAVLRTLALVLCMAIAMASVAAVIIYFLLK